MPILNWLNKEQAVTTVKNCSYRLLNQIPELSYGDQDTDNMIIQGDNIEALKALLPTHKSRVKCIFVDPPYNTQNAFEHYDDNLEHSKWLSMIYPRLELLYELLAEDGLFWIQLDDSEIHYCKVILDEIFGRDKFVTHVAYERSSAAGIGQGGFVVDTSEHILCYRKNIIGDHAVKNSGALELKTLKRYNKYLNKVGSRRIIREFESKSNGLPVKVYEYDNHEVKTISLRDYEKRKNEIDRELVLNFDTLFRTNQIQKENSFQKDLVAGMDKSKLYSVVYTPSRGKYKDKETELFYLNAELFSWLKDTADVEGGEIVKHFNLTNFWRHEDIPKADIANEGGVKFSRGKKPEQLLKRIFEMSTSEGDLVLDSFLGSGTTAAAAHKMKRKYIGIEFGDQAVSHCQKRLKDVVENEQSGITNSVKWQGGGGFKFYRLGEVIFNESGALQEGISFQALAAHIWFSITRKSLPTAISEVLNSESKSPLIGVFNGTAIYLLYNGILGDKRPQGGNVLTSKVLAILPEHPEKTNGKKLIFGETSRMGIERLTKENIIFKQIPYDIKGR